MMEDLIRSDRAPSELGGRFGLASNLLAHHLGVLEEAGLVHRTASEGDRRRRYVHADLAAAASVGLGRRVAAEPVVFVCTHNSARSQMAAALWERSTGVSAASAGTHPADEVRSGAIEAAFREGLDLTDAAPRPLEEADLAGRRVITVCDRAHEELETGPDWWHWSIPDPVTADTARAYDGALGLIARRIDTITGGA